MPKLVCYAFTPPIVIANTLSGVQREHRPFFIIVFTVKKNI